MEKKKKNQIGRLKNHTPILNKAPFKAELWFWAVPTGTSHMPIPIQNPKEPILINTYSFPKTQILSSLPVLTTSYPGKMHNFFKTESL